MSMSIDFWGTGTGAEVIDLIYHQNDGILSGCNLGLERQESDGLSLPELTFDDCFNEEFLNCLNEVDLLSGFQINEAEIGFPTHVTAAAAEKSVSVSSTSASHESDHQYCKQSGETSPPVLLDCFSGSPTGFGFTGDSLFSSSNSPTTTVTTTDEVASSPEQSEPSPLGGMMEYSDVNYNLDPISLLIQGSGLDRIVEDNGDYTSGLVSLDMDTGDVNDSSDDDNTFATIPENSSIFGLALRHGNAAADSLPFTVHDASPKKSQTNKSRDIVLSEEEMALLAREGIELPNGLPLTKEEERALKAVRRKIRNKMSAKVSRKRKQEYMDGLEKRVKICTLQNRQLQQKVEKLEKQNISLMSQLKRLQSMITTHKFTDNLMTIRNSVPCSQKQAQAGTFIMVLVLSFSLIVLPNFNPLFSPNQGTKELGKTVVGPGRSRSLLETVDNQPFSANIPIPGNDYYSSESQEDINYAKIPYPFRPSLDRLQKDQRDVLPTTQPEKEFKVDKSQNDTQVMDGLVLESVAKGMDDGEAVDNDNNKATLTDGSLKVEIKGKEWKDQKLISNRDTDDPPSVRNDL